MRTLLVVGLLLVPLVPAESLEFHLFRDTDESRYVMTTESDAPYDVGTWGSGAAFAATGRDWTFAVVGMAGPVPLDPEGTIDVTVRIGGAGTESGRAEVGWQLLVDGNVAAAGAPQEVIYSGEFVERTWSVAAPEVELDNEDALRVYTMSHVGVGARIDLEPSALVVSVAGDPAPPPPPPTGIPHVYEEADGPTFGHDLDGSEQVVFVNWTVGHATDRLRIVATGDGAGNLTVLTPGDATAYDGIIASAEKPVNTQAGVWQVRLTSVDYDGRVEFEAIKSAETTTSGTEGTTTGTQSTTSTSTTDPSTQESPLPLLLLVFALLFVARRR